MRDKRCEMGVKKLPCEQTGCPQDGRVSSSFDPEVNWPRFEGGRMLGLSLAGSESLRDGDSLRSRIHFSRANHVVKEFGEFWA